MWLPHSTHRLPNSCGSSAGHVKTPASTGTRVGMSLPPRAERGPHGRGDLRAIVETYQMIN
jgi:hypothetical protein